MASKITDLPADTTVNTTDVVPVVDLGANTTKKATVRQILEGADGIVATLSGSTFTGAITAAAAGGITGSITRTTAGTPFITTPSGNIITVTTGSNGQIILSGSGDGVSGGVGVPGALSSLTRSLSYNPTNDQLAVSHSGSTTRLYDSRLISWEFPISGQTTNATETSLFTFTSGTNGKSYAIDYRLQAQSSTTTGSLYMKGEGHFERSGGVMSLRANASNFVYRTLSTMSGSLSGSAGNVVLTATGLAGETFNWRGFINVQECG